MGSALQHLPSSQIDGKNKNLKRKTRNIDTKNWHSLMFFLVCPEQRS